MVPGDIVKIDTEEFYVVKHDGDDLVLLTHYNLKVGNNYDKYLTKIGEYTSSDSEYGIQSSDARGFVSGSSSNGLLSFSTTNYWDGKIGNIYPGNYCSSSSETNCAYVYDSNSSLY